MKAGGLKAYVAALVVTILFPLVWRRSLRLARRHAAEDPRAPLKVGAAIVVGVVILAGGAYLLVGFQEAAVDGMYESMETRLAVAVGETSYNDNVATVASANNAIPIIEENLAKARAAGDQVKSAELEKTLNDTRKQRSDAQAMVVSLTPNHQLFLRLQPLLRDQDDAAILRAVEAAGFAEPASMVEGTEAALAIKDRSIRDMQWSMWLFVWPSLVGAFFAPLAFVLGSILKSAFEESGTVGYKRYPGAAAGWFLLFGAFGLPSIPFAAWVFLDAENRSVEGQIAL